ncbi:MAG: ATP-dependent helicase HrpB [Planctomycetota bacterium]
MTRLPADLPVASVLAEAVAASRTGAVVVTAPPGSGKTMLVPAAILDDLPANSQVILLQPRRLAARAVARQIAHLRGGEPGGEVGYRVRFESCVGRDTRLVVETTGIMLRRLVGDMTIEGIGAVVLDEFHERSLEMDLILGLLVRLRETLRPDLRIVVMSATLDAAPVAALLGVDGGGCPVVSAQGRVFPVQTRYLRHGDRRDLVERVATTVPEAVRGTDGHVLVFLPGVGEIIRCQQEIGAALDRQGIAVLPLYGDLPPDQQDRVLADIGRRKVILSTNVAETSLTIPGVTAVIDSGLARQSLVSHATGLPRLELVPISQASADQRAGRAGRTAPGICWRLWDEAAHQHRPAADLPEAVRGDLAGPLLQLMALGEANDFPWLDPPPPEAMATARSLLAHLGAVATTAAGRDEVTPPGHALLRLPAHPRLARLLLAGARHGVLREASVAAALLSERDPFRTPRGGGPRDRHTVRTRSDVVDRVAALQAFRAGIPIGDPSLEPHPGGAHNVLRVAEQLYHLVDVPLAERAADPAAALMLALLEAFPDRLAKLRPGTQDRAAMVGGRGVRLDSSRLRGEPLFLAIDLDDASGEADVRLASAVERSWLDLEPLATANLTSGEELLFHPSRRQVEARLRTSWMDLALEETPTAIRDEAPAAALLAREAAAVFDRVMPPVDSPAGAFLARLRWLAATMPDLALPTIDDAALKSLLPELCSGLRSLDEVRAADWLSRLQAAVGYDRLTEIDRLAPTHLDLPNGKRFKLQYEPSGPPILAVRIQELFGVTETPRIAGGRIPLVLHLLGPNHRPQQVTSDLASFWKNTYPTVKKELRRRYPKHKWPDDPLAMAPIKKPSA